MTGAAIKGAEKLSLSVLLIEDNAQDEYMVRRMLAESTSVDYDVQSLRSRAAARDALAAPFDICLLDYDLGDFNAADLLQGVRPEDLSGPVILLTGHDEFSLDHSVMAMGVSDFISKSELRTSLLDRTLRYAHHRFADQRELEYVARHDALTGLLNRHTFLDRLHGWLRSSEYKSSELYLLYIDLDGFKAINDSWGHDTGDQVLRHAAQCIRNAVRTTDLVARYGGDELIAAVAHIDDHGIAALPQKILERLRVPLLLDGREIVVTASVGIARAHHARGDADELIRLADHAMFAAKHAGRDTSRMFSDAIPVAHRGRAQMESDLRAALQQQALHLHYQPVVDLETRRIKGAEALARWNHPEHGAVSPAQFVALAEECGLIRQLTQWSLDAALATLAQWQKDLQLPADFRLAVNISPPQLLDPDFPGLLDELLARHGVARTLLRLEITENFLVHHSAISTLTDLVQDGLSLALDDFGTGYSSLAVLSQLPLDTLKIDRTFVTRMGSDPRATALVRGLITLGQEMGLQVVAEGIETEAEHEQLFSYGCNTGQGYLYAYPANSDQLALSLAQAAGQFTDAGDPEADDMPVSP